MFRSETLGHLKNIVSLVTYEKDRVASFALD
jgi:hypothetical protein